MSDRVEAFLKERAEHYADQLISDLDPPIGLFDQGVMKEEMAQLLVPMLRDIYEVGLRTGEESE